MAVLAPPPGFVQIRPSNLENAAIKNARRGPRKLQIAASIASLFVRSRLLLLWWRASFVLALLLLRVVGCCYCCGGGRLLSWHYCCHTRACLYHLVAGGGLGGGDLLSWHPATRASLRLYVARANVVSLWVCTVRVVVAAASANVVPL